MSECPNHERITIQSDRLSTLRATLHVLSDRVTDLSDRIAALERGRTPALGAVALPAVLTLPPTQCSLCVEPCAFCAPVRDDSTDDGAA